MVDTENIEELYRLYGDFYDCMEKDIKVRDEPFDPQELPPAWRTKMSCAQFEEWWGRICQNSDLKDRWLQHLRGGYKEMVQMIDKAVDVLLQSLPT